MRLASLAECVCNQVCDGPHCRPVIVIMGYTISAKVITIMCIALAQPAILITAVEHVSILGVKGRSW